MSSPSPQSVPQPKVVVVDEQSPSFDFRRWPLRDEPIPSAIVFLVVVALSIGISYLGGTYWWGMVAATALLVSLWRMWIPVEFELCDLGVIQTAMRRSWRKPWDAYVGYEVRNDGFLLVPVEDSSLLGRLKGLYIPFGDQRDDILEVLAEYLPRLNDE